MNVLMSVLKHTFMITAFAGDMFAIIAAHFILHFPRWVISHWQGMRTLVKIALL